MVVDQPRHGFRDALDSHQIADRCAGNGLRRAEMLQHFGTAKAVSRAAVSDLMAVEGISEAVARLIYNHFHESSGD